MVGPLQETPPPGLLNGGGVSYHGGLPLGAPPVTPTHKKKRRLLPDRDRYGVQGHLGHGDLPLGAPPVTVQQASALRAMVVL